MEVKIDQVPERGEGPSTSMAIEDQIRFHEERVHRGKKLAMGMIATLGKSSEEIRGLPKPGLLSRIGGRVVYGDEGWARGLRYCRMKQVHESLHEATERILKLVIEENQKAIDLNMTGAVRRMGGEGDGGQLIGMN